MKFIGLIIAMRYSADNLCSSNSSPRTIGLGTKFFKVVM